MKSFLVRLLILMVVASFVALPAVTTFAQDDDYTVDVTLPGDGSIGLSSANLDQVVLNVIQWVLGFLGLIAVIMIIYGGFIWMTAGGNEEKVASAKKIISAAIIGLVVVLLAWAIVYFIGQAIIDQSVDISTT